MPRKIHYEFFGYIFCGLTKAKNYSKDLNIVTCRKCKNMYAKFEKIAPQLDSLTNEHAANISNLGVKIVRKLREVLQINPPHIPLKDLSKKWLPLNHPSFRHVEVNEDGVFRNIYKGNIYSLFLDKSDGIVYFHIKLGRKGYKLSAARLIYEAFNNIILTKSMLVKFKDKNKTNIALSNLEIKPRYTKQITLQNVKIELFSWSNLVNEKTTRIDLADMIKRSIDYVKTRLDFIKNELDLDTQARIPVYNLLQKYVKYAQT